MKTFSEFLEERRINSVLVPLALLTGMGTAVNELGDNPSNRTPEEIQKALERAIADNKPENEPNSSDSKPKNPGTGIPLPPPVPAPKPTKKKKK